MLTRSRKDHVYTESVNHECDLQQRKGGGETWLRMVKKKKKKNYNKSFTQDHTKKFRIKTSRLKIRKSTKMRNSKLGKPYMWSATHDVDNRQARNGQKQLQ